MREEFDFEAALAALQDGQGLTFAFLVIAKQSPRRGFDAIHYKVKQGGRYVAKAVYRVMPESW